MEGVSCQHSRIMVRLHHPLRNVEVQVWSLAQVAGDYLLGRFEEVPTFVAHEVESHEP